MPNVIGQLYCLATNVDKQQKAADEIQRLLPHNDAQLTQDTLQQAVYLKACIKD